MKEYNFPKKTRDLWRYINELSEDDFDDDALYDRRNPTFKGKPVGFWYEEGEGVDPYDAILDPDFLTEYDKMSDEEKQGMLLTLYNMQLPLSETDGIIQKIAEHEGDTEPRKAADIWQHIKSLPVSTFEREYYGYRDAPMLKGKKVREPEFGGDIAIYDAVNEPDFANEYNKMSDKDRETLLMDLLFANKNKLGDKEKIIQMLDKPHDEYLADDTTLDEGLAGDTTLEEELMLDPEMPPEKFSKIAAEKRGAKKGEPAPDMNLGDMLSDRTQKNVISALSQYRW